MPAQDVGSPGVTDAADLRLIPGAATAIAALNASGAHVCIVTNQSAVGKGLLTPTVRRTEASAAPILHGPSSRHCGHCTCPLTHPLRY